MSNSAAHEYLVLWTIRAAVLCYAVRVLFDVASIDRPRDPAASSSRGRWLSGLRLVWTLGWLLYVVHVVAAFGVDHGWSHAVAYEETAIRTAMLTGVAWGGGLYFNHLVTLLWTLDVVFWWRGGPEFPDRHPRFVGWMHGYLAFMVVNGTVVFGPSWWRPVGGLFLAVVAATYFVSVRTRPASSG